MPSFSAVHDQEYSPRPCGVDAGQKFGRTSAVSQRPGKGGGGDWNLWGSRANSCRHAHDVHTGNAEEKPFGNTCFSRKAMANMKTDLHVRAPAAGQRNSAGASRHILRHERRRKTAPFMEAWNARIAPRCYGHGMRFRAVPHHGERPSPHQETEAGTSARNTTRSHSNIVRSGASRKFCRLTPPAEAGSSHRQTALWGGGGQYALS